MSTAYWCEFSSPGHRMVFRVEAENFEQAHRKGAEMAMANMRCPELVSINRVEVPERERFARVLDSLPY